MQAKLRQCPSRLPFDRPQADLYGARRSGWRLPASIAARHSGMSESGPPDPLRRLGEELDKARSRERKRLHRDVTSSGGAMGFGLRVGIELIAALIVGVGLGWLADRYLGIRPWGLIAGFFLGSAAGIMSAFRAVQGMGGSPPSDRER